MDLSARFRALRESKGMSVYRLSKLSDVSENYIHTIEKGGNQPSVAILEKLLIPLGINLSEFFNESDNLLYPTDFELELIKHVRVLDKEKADAVFLMAKLLST
ncbi:hypothetical protein CE91St41_21360 [Oscillospiraceae bacterium]|nr:hypothetical protein CE91St40_16170 [Oscillospiraceae bacterium]BDF75247.1 hypothetical protein CE91St41_21360 [Oscillospiraceae bacterium]